MSIETWREKYAHLLEEMTLEHNYSDEAQSKDYGTKTPLAARAGVRFGEMSATTFLPTLAGSIDRDESTENGFFVRPQIRRNGARTVERTVPAWFFNDTAIAEFLTIQFPKLTIPHKDSIGCKCARCREHTLRSEALWYAVITGVRNNRSAEEIARDWSPAKPKTKAPIRPKKSMQREDDSNTKVVMGQLGLPVRRPSKRCAEYWEKVLASHDLKEISQFDTPDFHPNPKHKPITAAHVRRILQEIRFVAAGRRTDGKPRTA